MRTLFFLLLISLLCSCGMVDESFPPSESFIITEDYAPFQGDFSGDFVGGTVTATFSNNKVYTSCANANVTVYFEYKYILDDNTITTYNGEEGIIWWFQCNDDAYVWLDGNTVQITDSKYSDQVLVLHRED